MSFIGLGIGDVVLVADLALRLYHAFKSAPKDFEDLAFQLLSVSQIVDQIKDVYEQIYLNRQQRIHLQHLLLQTHSLLKELDDDLKHYGKNGHEGGKWQILKRQLNAGGGNQLKQRLIEKVIMLTNFNTTVTVWSLTDIKRKMSRLVQEKAESSAISTRTYVDERNSSQIYLQKELEQVGIAKEVIEKNRPYFAAWLAAAITENKSPDPTIDELWKGPFEEETSKTCLFCDSDKHESRRCQSLGVFDPNPPPSCPEPIPIPGIRASSTHSRPSGSSIRRGSATMPPRSKSSFASTFGMESSIASGFSPAPGVQFAPSFAHLEPASSIYSNSIHDQTRSRDGSVITTTSDPGKRRSIRSIVSNKFERLGSSAPSVNHGLSF